MKLLISIFLLTISLNSFAGFLGSGIRCNMLMNSNTEELNTLKSIEAQISDLKLEILDVEREFEITKNDEEAEVLEAALSELNRELKFAKINRKKLSNKIYDLQMSIVNQCGILSNSSFE